MADLIDRKAAMTAARNKALQWQSSFAAATEIADAIAALPAQGVRVKPTDAQVASACMSYRHDFGLLSEDERKTVMFQAREWLHAWQKELAALTPAEAGGVEAHDEQLGVWADELMADLVLSDLMDLVDHEYDTKVGARRTIIDALKTANQAKVPAPAPVEALVKAAEALHADMLRRARTQIDAMHGDQYRIVNAGRTAWHDFDAALAAIREGRG